TPTNTSDRGFCGTGTEFTCVGSDLGGCCSQWGQCGTGIEYCAQGCQVGFGKCD
ncbi:uncharacterized protein K452DRAFT_239622, partial [Aplosporella prunicola CBS 121167]